MQFHYRLRGCRIPPPLKLHGFRALEGSQFREAAKEQMMRKRSIQGIVVFVGLLFPTGLVHSQTAARFTPRHLASSPAQSALARATPEDVGLSSERLGANSQRNSDRMSTTSRIAGGRQPGGAAWQSGLPPRCGHGGPRSSKAHADGQHLSHVLHDQSPSPPPRS